MKNKKLLALLLAALCASLFATGCNTMKGVGRDVEKAGNELQDAAK